MNVLDCAIDMEEEAMMYYEVLATSAPDPELKNLALKRHDETTY